MSAENDRAAAAELPRPRSAAWLPRRSGALLAISIGLTLFNGGPAAETIDPRLMLAHARRLQQAPGAGNLRRAGALYRRALAFGHTMLDGHSRIEAWTEIGHVEARLGDLKAEIAAYETALGLVRQLADRAAEAGVLNDLGRARRKAGDLGAARKAYETALVAAQVATNVREEATALNNLARLEYIAGDAQAAIHLYDKALGRWQHARDSNGEAITLSNLGEAYVLLGRPEDGIDFYTRALRILEASGNDRAAAATWTMMGWARFALGKREEALQAYLRAAALQDRAGDVAGRAGTLDRLGTAYRKLGRLDMAFATYRESLRISEQSGSVLDAGNTRFNLCELYLESDRLREAEAECRRARQLLAAVEDRSAVAHGWFLSAQIARRRGQLGRAQDCVEQALAVVDGLWQQPGSRALRASFLTARRSYFDFYLDLLLARHSADPGAGWDVQAFKLSERLRTRGLVDALLDKRDQERERGDADSTISSHDDTLRLRIEALLPPAAGELNDPVHLSRLRSLRRQRDAELSGGADSRPRPALLSAQVPTLVAAQRTLADERTALLIYAVAERSSVLWVVTSERVETHLLPGRSTLQAQVAALERLLESEPQSSTDMQTQIVLRQVSRTLLDPAASGLRADRLVVVPDGPLHFVPFAALPVPRRLRSPGNEPLLEQHEILYIPSISALIASAGLRDQGPFAREVLVAADPVFDAAGDASRSPLRDSTAKGTGASARRDRGGWKRLPGARIEGERIAEIAGKVRTTLLLDFDASRDRVLLEFPRHRIVHLATHAQFNSRFPELSGIVLSTIDRQEREEVGFLRVQDLYGARLPTQLVVLSGCQTARGGEVYSEGLVGFFQALMVAGTRQLVANLWNANDKATPELMAVFYDRMLATGLPPAAALREAQLSLLHSERWQDPHYWAGFRIHGDWR